MYIKGNTFYSHGKKSFLKIGRICPNWVSSIVIPIKDKMQNRLNLFSKGQIALKPLFLMGTYLKESQIETALQELIKIRVSQINGCAYCLDMHWKDARASGETEQRLYGLSAWQESPYYSKRERAALKWAEAVICCKIPNSIYDEVSQHFTEEELIDLTMVCSLINTWNQLNIAFPKVAGTYQVGQWR